MNRIRQPPAFLAPVEDTFIAKESNVSMLDELEKQNKQLQTMVSHYKSIISETVSISIYLIPRPLPSNDYKCLMNLVDFC